MALPNYNKLVIGDTETTGFKENRIGMDSEIRLFLYKSYAKDYLKETYLLDENFYELVEVKITYELI